MFRRNMERVTRLPSQTLGLSFKDWTWQTVIDVAWVMIGGACPPLSGWGPEFGGVAMHERVYSHLAARVHSHSAVGAANSSAGGIRNFGSVHSSANPVFRCEIRRFNLLPHYLPSNPCT